MKLTHIDACHIVAHTLRVAYADVEHRPADYAQLLLDRGRLGPQQTFACTILLEKAAA